VGALVHILDSEKKGIPEKLRPLFWDCAFDDLSWPADRDFIIGRVLVNGDWDAVQWLRKTAGDSELEEWLRHRHGGSLSPERLRFWELVLHLPHRTVNDWIKTGDNSIWHRRAAG
jgi:hypothetical protein